jgi:radical SAM superfamily enzyme YgiQ (UPF0313 family)
MRIVFVDNILLDHLGEVSPKDLQPQLGLISLIRIVEDAGHEAVLYSPMLDIAYGELSLTKFIYQRMTDRILRHKPDVVGFTTLGCNFIVTVQVAALLKQQLPTLPIILGGPHATVLHRVIMERFSQFDFVVLHEAEAKILPLLDSIASGDPRSAPGVTWRDQGAIVSNPGVNAVEDLDSLPFPAYSHFPIQTIKPGFLRLEAGRGCPFSCTFCSTATFFGRKFRIKSPFTIRRQLERLRETYGVTRFSLQHDLFTVNRNKVVEFCDALLDQDFTWTCSARIDCVDEELLNKMGKAGCRAIYYGIESGSPHMQSAMKKRLDLQLLIPRLDDSLRANITPTVSFIIGYPQETIDDLNETLDVLGECVRRYHAGIVAQLHLLTPEPGTALLEEFKHCLDFDGHISDFNFPLLRQEDESIMRANPDIFMTHYFYRGPVSRFQNIFVSSAFHSLLHYGLPFLAHLIEVHGGKLSKLMSDMLSWAQENGIQPALTKKEIIKYLQARNGKGHYLVSCARHISVAADLKCGPETERTRTSRVKPKAEVANEARSFRWSPSATVMRRVHNSASILSMIEKRISPDKIFASAKDAPRGTFLMVKDRSDSTVVHNYSLDKATEAVIDVIQRSTSDDEVQAWLSAVGIHKAEAEAFRLELARIGCLEQTSFDSQHSG